MIYFQIKIEREGAKLLYSKNLTHDAIETILTSIVNTVGAIQGPSVTGLSKSAAATAAELNARSLVTLAKWLQADAKYTAHVASQMQQSKQSEDAEVPMIAKRLKVLTDLKATESGTLLLLLLGDAKMNLMCCIFVCTF